VFHDQSRGRLVAAASRRCSRWSVEAATRLPPGDRTATTTTSPRGIPEACWRRKPNADGLYTVVEHRRRRRRDDAPCGQAVASDHRSVERAGEEGNGAYRVGLLRWHRRAVLGPLGVLHGLVWLLRHRAADASQKERLHRNCAASLSEPPEFPRASSRTTPRAFRIPGRSRWHFTCEHSDQQGRARMSTVRPVHRDLRIVR
jgi:hypothetical protein